MKAIIGRWRVIEMEQWDKEFIDMVEPGFISFEKGGHGEMRFGAVNLELDWEASDDGNASFTFAGFDEGDEVTGRGWARASGAKLVGQIKFHQGDKSKFTAKPWSRKR
jgi:hypothetical protein